VAVGVAVDPDGTDVEVAVTTVVAVLVGSPVWVGETMEVEVRVG
jgi:hypothetical protein